jgi:feruloyl esterase
MMDAMNFSMDDDAPKIYATDDTYTIAPFDYMTPPNPTDLHVLRDRGAKLIVFHGIADGVFSPNDTVAWYQGLAAANGGEASDFARLFLIPGMNHCSGGPCTDQFDMVDALVDWVEQGLAPDRIIATARGEGNVGGENEELPADWAPDRTRPLCPYPQFAKYSGSGDLDDAASFICEAP